MLLAAVQIENEGGGEKTRGNNGEENGIFGRPGWGLLGFQDEIERGEAAANNGGIQMELLGMAQALAQLQLTDHQIALMAAILAFQGVEVVKICSFKYLKLILLSCPFVPNYLLHCEWPQPKIWPQGIHWISGWLIKDGSFWIKN
jgi:hypothetical protein